ncbi:MAG: putative manganese-dependent inorganic diphosphatase, partial [Crenarchaeota archaeon]|nr:putative manganese-dependent inorganic diphosphatase [Thermoproteota archaeon]
LVEDVRPRARDVMTRDIRFVKVGEPVKFAIDTLVSIGVRSLPVVDEVSRVTGLFSVESFARRFAEELASMRLTLEGVPLRNFVAVSNGRVLVGEESYVLSGRVYVAAMGIDDIDRRGEELRGNIVVVGSREDVVDRVIDVGVKTVVLTGGFVPSERVLAKARERGVTIVSSPYDTYTTLRLLDLSQPVERFSEPPIRVHEDALLSEVREAMVRGGARAIVVVDEFGRLRGMITRSDLVKDFRKKVALVDHNEFSQSIEGIEEAEIVAVVDHHRLSGDIETHKPVFLRVEPVGSTCTIIWRMFREEGIEVDRGLAEAMLYAILSDTLLFRSSTTTDMDRAAAESLAKVAGVEMKAAIEFMRLAMAANEPSDPREIVTRDLKVFEIGGTRFGIAQVFTTRPENYLAMAVGLREVMDRIRREKGLEFLVLMVTDYIEGRSFITAVGRADPVARAFGEEVTKNFVELKGVTSRKKDVLPRILEAIESES